VHRAVVVEAEEGENAAARLGASLELEDTTGDRITFHLVGTHEADVLDNKISDESPLGQNLLGKRAGDKVELPLGSDKVDYKVVSVYFE